MPDEAKPVIRQIAAWASGATVISILIQVFIGSFLFGQKLEKKADRAVVEQIRQEWSVELKESSQMFSNHRAEQALREGNMESELKNIAEDIREIKQALHRHNDGG